MSQYQVHFYEFCCDASGCKVRVVARSLPEGWTTHTKRVGPCGLTDYYDHVTHDFCPACSAEGKGVAWAKQD